MVFSVNDRSHKTSKDLDDWSTEGSSYIPDGESGCDEASGGSSPITQDEDGPNVSSLVAPVEKLSMSPPRAAAIIQG